MGSSTRDWMRDTAPPGGRWGPRGAVWRLLGIQVGLWLVYAAAGSGGRGGGGLHAWISEWLLLHPEDVALRGRLWQPFTAIWFHDPSTPWHLVWNLVGLWVFGGPVEERLGGRALVSLFVRAGLASTLVIVGLGLLRPAPVTALGASGGVYGLAAFLALREPRRRIVFFVLEVPLWAFVGLFLVGIEVVNLLVLARPTATTLGHLAGAAYGYAHHRWLAPDRRGGGSGLLARWRGPRERVGTRRAPSEGEADLRGRVDALLAKISREGIAALSDAEKDYLQEASRRYPPS